MNEKEFYETIKNFAKLEMFSQAEKANNESDPIKSAMHQGASHEASKFYKVIESLWIDSSN